MSVPNPVGQAPALLRGYTALDFTDEKGQMCGRFLADLGMEVIKVELPEGDRVRHLGPFLMREDGVEESARFAHLNAGKKSVVLDYRDPANRDRILQECAKADVVLESFSPGYLSSLRLGYAELKRANPSLVMASITGFGQTGPRAHYACTDIVAYAMSGLMFMGGEPTLPPCKPPETQAYYFGSLMAALGVVAALYSRHSSGQGDWVDVSMQEALANQEHIIRAYAMEGKILRRLGSMHGHVAPGKVFPCRDGHVYLYMNRGHWVRFLEVWTDHPTELDDPALLAEPVRWTRAEMIHAHLERFTARYGKNELTELMQSNRIPCAPVNHPAEWMADEQVRERQFLRRPDDEVASGPKSVCAPYLLNGCRPSVRRAPRLAEHQERLSQASGTAKIATGTTPQELGARAPLAGVRVLSFDQILAGPYATTLLAELGADVIKVESRRGGLDMFRFFGKGQDPNLSPRFFEFNRNKRSVTINLKSPEGPGLIKALNRQCDAVLDNYSVHVMPSLGLDFEHLSGDKPDTVTVRMPGLGCTGPKNEYATVGTIITALTGFTYLWNHPGTGRPPEGSATVLPDYVAGVMAAVLIVAAKLHKERFGAGVSIDISQAEAASYLLGASLMQAQESPDKLKPVGNRSPDAAPQGCYPVLGEDRWCVISVETDMQWQALSAAMGQPALATDPRYVRHSDRVAHADELDVAIEEWTRGQEAYVLMELLQARGVPCGVVQTGADLVADPHLRARAYLVETENPRLGHVTLPGFPIRFSNAHTDTDWSFPVLGADSHEVCTELLGMAPEQIIRLESDGVLD